MRVRLRSRILYEIANELQFGRERFRQEEGGYLAGRFDGESIEIVSHWRDLNAARSSGSIRLRESHLDYVTEQIEQTGDSSLYVVGTWHVHPPGYGAHPSPTDREFLFLEHAAIRAGGLADSRLPQAHLIIGWGDLYNYHVYTMKVDIAGLQISPCEGQPEHLQTIKAAFQQHNEGGGILLRSVDAGFDTYAGPLISEAVTTGVLDGLFWLFPYPTIGAEVERIYLANFIHHVRQAARSLNRTSRDKTVSLTYYRITGSEGRFSIMPLRLQFSLRDKLPEASHAPCFVSEEITVLLNNPDSPDEAGLNLGAQAHTQIGDIGRVMQSFRGLEVPPILSTRRPVQEEEKWRNRTVMDEFGEVLLPDDVNVVDLLDDQSVGAVNLYWRSPDLHPRMVYSLRTQRLQGLGYDCQRLSSMSVLVAGVGLLGSELVLLLTASGLGRLALVDEGTVDFTNIYRQQLYERLDVYQAKVNVAVRRLSGAGIQVEGHRISIPTVSGNPNQVQNTLAALDALVAQSSLVIGTVDSFSGRAVLQTLCLHRQVPFLSVALDWLDPIGAQSSIFLALPERPGCYACGRSLAPARDHGVCTIAPLEFSPIASGFAFRVAMNVLHGRVISSKAIQIYHNLNVEEQEISNADPQCAICGPDGVWLKGKENPFKQIHRWLHGDSPTLPD
jgi:molybdopterin/thiamine biosynthesis adenylyltransferase